MGREKVRTTRLRIGKNRTVGPCAQSRVPRAIATGGTLSNDRRESVAHFERPAKQELALRDTEP